MNSQIIGKALIVLNKKGYVHTQLQDILEEANITLEEFHRYYPDFKALVVTIFNQFCHEADQFSVGLDQTGSSVENFFNAWLATCEAHKKYPFIFHDFYYLNTEINEVQDRYFELLRLRKAQFSHLFQTFVEEGMFKKEVIPGQFENLINQIMVMGGFWPTHSVIIFGEYKAPYYSRLTLSMLIPYFTEKGMEEYNRLVH